VLCVAEYGGVEGLLGEGDVCRVSGPREYCYGEGGEEGC